jgi:hypothetical protein
MNDLYKALGDISSIRKQMARSTEFRGFRSLAHRCIRAHVVFILLCRTR